MKQFGDTGKKVNKRGRKPKGDQLYIEESIRQIALYEQELDQQEDGKPLGEICKRKSKLYAKMSALKSRVKRKQEQMF